MPIMIPTDEQRNLYIHFMHFLNGNNGKMFANDGRYYDFLNSNLCTHEILMQAITICKPHYKQYPYILHMDGRTVGSEGGAFYLTSNGHDIIKNYPATYLPAAIYINKPKPKITKEEVVGHDIPKKKPEQPWTKEEVVRLLTKEAHIVGRMLGTGYDLLEPIHGDWIYQWVVNPSGFKVVVHQAHRNSYKCFSPDTKVMMADCTIKKIKDIQIGEYVMGWDSTPRKVLSKHSGIDDMYRVTLNKNGEYYECNSNHILTMRQTSFKNDKFHCVDEYRDKKDPMMIDIPLKEFISNPAYTRRKKGNETFFKHFKVGLKNIKKQKVDIPPYVLGCHLGDGCTDKIAITTMDEEIRREYKEWCESLGLVEHVYTKKNASNKAKTYQYSVKHFCKKDENKAINALKKYNLWGNKHIPIEYLNNSEEVRLELLAGLIDTDGHYGKSTKHYIYTTTLENLAKQVEWLARSLGFNATAKQIDTWCMYKGVKKDSKAWQVYINGNEIHKIPVRLERKKAEIKTRKDNRHMSFSQSIEPIGKGEFVGIEIEGDGRYLLDTFTVVHNSSCLRLAIAIMMILKPLTTIIVFRKSEDAVKECINGVSKILDTPLFHTFVNILYPDIAAKGGFKKTTDTALAIDTNLNISISGEFQLRALGLGSALTGKHAELIITDDICTTEDRESTAARMETIMKYQEFMNLLSQGKGFNNSRILNIGTPWHEEDVFKLMEKGLKPKSELQEKIENIPFKKRTERHLEKLRRLNMRRGLFVYNCYQTGLMTEEDIEWKKKTLNDDVLFAANYMLTLVSDDEKPFPKIDNVGHYTKAFFAEAWEVFAHIDAAYDGADRSSLSIGGFDWDNNTTVVYGKMYKTALDKNYLELAEEMWNCGVQKIYMENNTDKGLMGEKFRELGFDVEGYHESMNKHTKIVSSIRPFWRETGEDMLPCVQFVEETDDEYLAEIYNYKKGVKHDDAPDDLASLLIRSKFGALAVRIT